MFFSYFLGLEIKLVATGCQILRLKCTKFNFDWGSAQTSLGKLSVPPDA